MKLPALTAGGVVAVVGIAAGAFVAYKLWKLAQNTGNSLADVAMHTATVDLNPTNRDNLANRAFLAIPRAITGDDSWSLGGWVYDVTHPGAFANPDTPFTPAPVRAGPGLTASEQMGFPL